MSIKKFTTESQRTPGRFLIIEARFYGAICDELAKGAIAAIERSGAKWERLAVPGALELPGAIALADATGIYDGYVALGCVLRGETSHYDTVAGESARGIMDLTVKGLAIGNGILTCENEAQAWTRARVEELDKGGGAAETALAMVRYARQMKRRKASIAKKKAAAK
jgi:6,7-dimethyl-8-ribityllumazine synthase